jgi:hypothetical protein
MARAEVTGLMVVPTVIEASLARVASAIGEGPASRAGPGAADGGPGVAEGGAGVAETAAGLGCVGFAVHAETASSTAAAAPAAQPGPGLMRVRRSRHGQGCIA